MAEYLKSDIELKFRGKYRVPSARLQKRDYSQNGLYFVTICTRERECILGKIINGEMRFSEIGNIAKKYWVEIPNHFPFIKLGTWVIMPNHVHGILIFEKPVETHETLASLQQQSGNKFGPQSRNLASVIRGFKIGITKYCRQNTNIYAPWQTRFHDRIIRNNKELKRISEYIKSNPLNWVDDELYSQ